tara:strand:- start:489 stop:689 length:201 start_codon:yes stop_codon:yes gene_type:complete
MNCSHDGDGWCLSCVGELNRELITAKGHVAALVSKNAILQIENDSLQNKIDRDWQEQIDNAHWPLA